MDLSNRNQQIGKNLERLRDGMSQETLATLMRKYGHKWSKATVWSVERGDRPLKLTEANDILRILKYDPSRDMPILLRDSRDSEVATLIEEAHDSLQCVADSCDDAAEICMKIVKTLADNNLKTEVSGDLISELEKMYDKISSESLVALCMRITMQVWPDDYDPNRSFFKEWVEGEPTNLNYMYGHNVDMEEEKNRRYSILKESEKMTMDERREDGGDSPISE